MKNHIDFLYHFACFYCNNSFKRPAVNGAPSDSAHRTESEVKHRCPKCNALMAFMGRQFRPPKKQDKEEWLVIRALWEAGFRFTGNGQSQPVLPQKKSEINDFLQENQNHNLRTCSPQKWIGEINKVKLDREKIKTIILSIFCQCIVEN